MRASPAPCLRIAPMRTPHARPPALERLERLKRIAPMRTPHARPPALEARPGPGPCALDRSRRSRRSRRALRAWRMSTPTMGGAPIAAQGGTSSASSGNYTPRVAGMGYAQRGSIEGSPMRSNRAMGRTAARCVFVAGDESRYAIPVPDGNCHPSQATRAHRPSYRPGFSPFLRAGPPFRTSHRTSPPAPGGLEGPPSRVCRTLSHVTSYATIAIRPRNKSLFRIVSHVSHVSRAPPMLWARIRYPAPLRPPAIFYLLYSST